MARGVSDGFCQMVALPLTIWHGQCVIDTSGTPIFYAHFRTLAWSKRTVRAAAELDTNVQFGARFGVLTLVSSESCTRSNLQTEFRSG